MALNIKSTIVAVLDHFFPVFYPMSFYLSCQKVEWAIIRLLAEHNHCSLAKKIFEDKNQQNSGFFVKDNYKEDLCTGP